MSVQKSIVSALVLSVMLTAHVSVLSAEESIELRVNAGDTIEIGTDSRAIKPEFSWILTKDRKFQNAQRSRFFQTRFTQAGTYILDVSIQDPSGNGNDYRAFTIIVGDQPSSMQPLNQTALDTTPLRAVLQSSSPIVGGKIYVPVQGGLIKIDPSRSEGKLSSYDIDLDSTIDANGDGDTTNDRDTADSLSSRTGSPVYLYIVPKAERRNITLTVSSLTNPLPSKASLEIAYGQAPAIEDSQNSSLGSDVIQNPGSIIRLEKRNGSVFYVAEIDPSMTAGKELLYAWDFGDRSQSLLTSPRHSYGGNGTYTVTLTVRDIVTGTTITTEATSVTIDDVGTTSSSSGSSSVSESSSSSSSSPTQNVGEKSGSMGAILWVGAIVLFIFLLFLALVGIVVVLKSKFTGKLQNTLEKMEKTIVQKDTNQDIIETKAEPMKLRKDDAVKENGQNLIVEREKSVQEFKSADVRTNETPVNSSGPVPSWLAKSPSTEPKQVANKTIPPPAPAPSWLKPDAVSTGRTEPVPEKVTPPPASTSGPVPAWLEMKPAPVTVVPPVVAPLASPTVSPAVAQAPEVVQSVTEKVPAPAPDSVPDTVSVPAPDSISDPEPAVTVTAPKEKTVQAVPVSEVIIEPAKITPKADLLPPSNTALVNVEMKAETVSANAERMKDDERSEEKIPASAVPTSVDTPVVDKDKNVSSPSETESGKGGTVASTVETNSDDEPIAFVQADSLTNEA